LFESKKLQTNGIHPRSRQENAEKLSGGKKNQQFPNLPAASIA
jgi:hypothetical protein